MRALAVPVLLTVPQGTVAVHHTPRAAVSDSLGSVVLVHGISSNHRFWDLAPGRSLVNHLSERGFDVWNVDLAGHAPEAHGSHGPSSIDDHGRFDLPAVLAHVRAQSDGPIHYVGHSMGGMVLAVALATTDLERELASAVVVGSPLDFADMDEVFEGALRLRRLGRIVPSPAAARLMAVTQRNTLWTIDRLLYNPDNLTGGSEALMLRRVVSPLGKAEVAQFALAQPDGAFRSADGTVTYRDVLGHVRLPMLFIAGRADCLVPPDRVKVYYDSVGSADKRFLVAGVANGMHADYGHLDLGVGDTVAVDVYPPIVDWLSGVR